MIRGLFARAWDALSVTDLLDPAGAWEKIKAIFGPPVRRLVDFAIACGRKLLEFVFEGALALAGGAGQRILGIFRKIGAAFSLIVSDPIGFLANLIRAVKGGFQRFVANIWTHLKTALFQWLTGALGPIRLPAKWDLMGILSVILQILGLTYDRMRGKLVRLIGEPAVRAIETAFEFLKTIVTGGLAAAWQKLLEFASGLVDTVIGGIRDWVAKSVVGAAVTKLVTMFNPVGAIIQGIITICNTVMFFIERAQQIGALVESIVDSIANIARGSVGAAIDHVERTLARTLPVIISFLARLIGLGNITGTVRGIIERIQSTVSNAIDKVVGFVIDKAKALISRLTGRAGRPASAEGGRSGAVKEIARARLAERLPIAANRAQGEAIVAQVRNELRPQGLQRLEITAERPDGALVIAAAASAFDELMAYLFRPDAHSTQGKIYTRMATRITLAGTQAPFPQWPAVPGTTSPVTRPGQPGGAYAAAIAVEEERHGRPRSQPTFGGALFRPDPAAAGASTREVFAATYNTSDEAKACNNRTHAETQFRTWLGQQPTAFRDRVSAIDVEISYSPCTNCVPTLAGIGTLIPASAKLSLRYANVYPRTACRTTAASLDALRSAGWTVNGPAPAQ
jgi:hypothetical protein